MKIREAIESTKMMNVILKEGMGKQAPNSYSPNFKSIEKNTPSVNLGGGPRRMRPKLLVEEKLG